MRELIGEATFHKVHDHSLHNCLVSLLLREFVLSFHVWWNFTWKPFIINPCYFNYLEAFSWQYALYGNLDVPCWLIRSFVIFKDSRKS